MLISLASYYASLSATAQIRNLLFGEGQQGVLYYPRPIVDGVQSLYQDAAATTPVTADGDPVGWMRDLSGNSSNATQSTSASRPVYRTDGTLHWVKPDGVDDTLASMSFGFSSNGWSVFAAVGSIGVTNIGVHEAPSDLGSSSERFILGSASGRYKVWSDDKTAGSGDVIPTPSQPHIIGLVCDVSGVLHYYFDGQLAYSVTPSQAIDYSTILKLGIVNNGSSFPDDPVHGIVAVDYDLGEDSTKLSGLTTYLGNLAGITL